MTTDTKTAHTPTRGPWFVDADAGLIYSRLGPLTRFVVAMTESGSEDEQKANARLIAAAPELLAAVKARQEARAFAASVSAATPDGETPAKHMLDKADMLFAKAEKLERAAIARAEGRQP